MNNQFIRRPIAVALGSLVSTISLAQSAPPQETTLPPVQVKEKSEQENQGYQGRTTTVGKTAQAPRDVPQSLTIITEQLIQDQGATTLKDALRNGAGITFNAGEGGRNGDNITIRGYSIVGDLYLDGIRDVAQYNRDVFNLEQIDVLRGSASMLFGRGSTGGIVNQISKKPRLRDSGEVDLTYGSWNYWRATTDVNHVLGETSALRLNAMYTNADSFRDWVQYERWGVAPSYAWGIGTDDEINVSYYYLKESNIPDYGVPYFQGKPLDVPVYRFYGLANADYERYETGIATASYAKRIGGDVEWTTIVRYGDYRRDLWPSAPRLQGNPTTITDDTVVTRSRPARDGYDHDTTLQSNLVYRVSAGTLWHELLGGVEYAHEQSHTRRWSNAPGMIPTTTVDDPNAFPVLPPNFFDKNNVTVTDFKSNTYSIYAQDTVEVSPEWKAVAGARWDDFDANYQRAEPLGPLSREDRVWSWRTGIIWQPSDEQSYYVAYGTSFNPSGELYALDPRGANTPPEKNRNIEGGAKWEVQKGALSLRAAIFRSEKTNERNTDPLDTSQFLLSGKRHTDGIEFEAAGSIAPLWDVLGGVAWMHARVDQSLVASDVGKWPVNTPPYTASLWTTYRIYGPWKVGGGFQAVGKRYTTSANTTVLPPYTRWDALVEYEQPRYAVRVNFFNVFDTTYYEGLYTAHALPGTARAMHVTLAYKF